MLFPKLSDERSLRVNDLNPARAAWMRDLPKSSYFLAATTGRSGMTDDKKTSLAIEWRILFSIPDTGSRLGNPA